LQKKHHFALRGYDSCQFFVASSALNALQKYRDVVERKSLPVLFGSVFPIMVWLIRQ
jgi:hypothetical protein